MMRAPIKNNFSAQSGTYNSIGGCALGTVLPKVIPARAFLVGGQRPQHRKEAQVMSPIAILQAYLDRIGQAVLRERFEEYRELVELPLSILTSSASLTITTEEELLDGFDDYTDMLQSHAVTDMIRPVKAATFQGNDHIIGIYETRLMSGDRQVLPSFHSKMWIGCSDGIWKAIKIHNTTNEARWPMLLTRLPPDNWLSEEIRDD